MDAKYAKYFLNHRLLLKDGFFTYYLQSKFLSCDDILDVQTLVFDWPEDTEQWLLQCADHDYFETFYNLRDFLAEEEIDFGLHLIDDSRVLLAAVRCITDRRAPIVIQPNYGWTVKTDPGTGATTIPIAVEAAPDPDGLINELKHELDTLVAEQWEKYNANERRLAENNDIIEYSKAVGGGLYDFAAGTVTSTIDTIKAAATVMRAFDDLSASFKNAAAISLLHGTLDPLKKEIDAIVKPVADTYEQALEYKAVITTLFNDEETAELLTDFAKRYYKATHPLELTQMGISGSGDIILTIILIIFTAGVGAAANTAIKVKRLEKIAAILSKLAIILRRIGPRHRLPKLNKKAGTSAKKTAKSAAKKKKGIPDIDSPKEKGDLVDGDGKKRYGGQTDGDGSKMTKMEDGYHARTSPEITQSVLNKIDPSRFSPDTRFGKAFYVAEKGDVAVAEVAYHGATPTHVIRYKLDLSKAKVLDLTDPAVVKKWGSAGGNNYAKTQAIARKAQEAGFDAIKFPSQRVAGNNIAIFDKFDQILSPQMVTPVQ